MYGDLDAYKNGITLTHSGHTGKAEAMPTQISKVIQQGAMGTTRKFSGGADFTTVCNINAYSRKDQQVYPHRDQEPETVLDGRTLILPIGPTREFHFMNKKNENHPDFYRVTFVLSQGDALLIPRSFNYNNPPIFHSKGTANEDGAHFTIAARVYTPARG